MTLVDRESPTNQHRTELNDECADCIGCDQCDEFNPLVDVHGNEMGGMLPLFSAPDLDTLHAVLSRARSAGLTQPGGTLPDGSPALGVLREMLENQDIDRFIELGQQLQGWVDETPEGHHV